MLADNHLDGLHLRHQIIREQFTCVKGSYHNGSIMYAFIFQHYYFVKLFLKAIHD